jgi:hypothetical protein
MVAALAVGAVARASVLAAATIPIQPVSVEITYEGVYEYHETADDSNGTVVSYVNQKIGWRWTASGSVPVTFDGSKEYGVANLPGHLRIAGASSDTGAYSPPQNCTYGAGSGASSPIQVSLLLEGNGTFKAGYGIGIPGAASTCGGQASSSPTDVLDCDFNSCDGICPAGPPAVSSARFQTDVQTAFQPTTDYTDTGYEPLAGDHDKILGFSTVGYGLPEDTGSVQTSCQKLNSVVYELDTISIISTVDVSVNSGNVNFPTTLPAKSLPDLIALDPDLPSNPSISIPPDSPQPPDYPGLDELSPKLASKKTTSSGSHPTVGVITIRCPQKDRRCAGTLSVTATGRAPKGVLGRRSYSVPGGKEGILNVPLVSSAGTVLNRKGRLSVHVTVKSDVTPGSHHASGHRNVLLTKTPTIPGIPSS